MRKIRDDKIIIAMSVMIKIMRAELKKLRPKNAYIEVHKNNIQVGETGLDSRGPTPFWNRNFLIDFKEEDRIKLILKDKNKKIGECTIEMDDIRKVHPTIRFNKDLISADGECPGQLVVETILRILYSKENKEDHKPNEKNDAKEQQSAGSEYNKPIADKKGTEQSERIEDKQNDKNVKEAGENYIVREDPIEQDESVIKMSETRFKQQTEKSAEEFQSIKREYNKPVADKKGTEQSERIEDKQNDKNVKEAGENHIVTEDPIEQDESVVNMSETRFKQQTEKSAEEFQSTKREYNKPATDEKRTEPKQSKTIEDKQIVENLKEAGKNYIVREDTIEQDKSVVNISETTFKQLNSAEECQSTESECNKTAGDKKGSEPEQSETIEDKQNGKHLKEEGENYVVSEDPVLATKQKSCSYSNNANKKNIDFEDVKLAVALHLEKKFSTPPPREVLMDIARTKNALPLPPVKATSPKRVLPLQSFYLYISYSLRKIPEKILRT
ncbi:hypothetical protein QYM36_014934 [Artemia franciscana]|uniref:C2 domain-containing protein n=1 Tax=Artemia franciscana TaxID=6661 RepID=A0AA88HKI1_ARTSF|nr:hypothetical protein QYM36_014934 [Artemia franciscana]